MCRGLYDTVVLSWFACLDFYPPISTRIAIGVIERTFDGGTDTLCTSFSRSRSLSTFFRFLFNGAIKALMGEGLLRIGGGSRTFKGRRHCPRWIPALLASIGHENPEIVSQLGLVIEQLRDLPRDFRLVQQTWVSRTHTRNNYGPRR